ncbi:hypothetical protein JAAARDRAFT_48448 [Jaapia argillacea MUCL 33604]|uniref:Uncharacterized protein n=1 Tax=Jaapia argillacea MUCL 33604 TaxID=933084 RepID=A0A067PXU5_9AGAM|nr:hypothetical protein JAAARDRAFT_48448 [Jaapia argillacea MUCL 33604]
MLAQDSNAAPETYQKQVKVSEEHDVTMVFRNTALPNEVEQLQGSIGLISAEKLERETHAAQQAEALDQLTDTNDTLRARTLSLADEAPSSSVALFRLHDLFGEVRLLEDPIPLLTPESVDKQNMKTTDRIVIVPQAPNRLTSIIRSGKKSRPPLVPITSVFESGPKHSAPTLQVRRGY